MSENVTETPAVAGEERDADPAGGAAVQRGEDGEMRADACAFADEGDDRVHG